MRARVAGPRRGRVHRQRPLAVDETHTIDLPSGPASVTVLPANHCIGSVMYAGAGGRASSRWRASG